MKIIEKDLFMSEPMVVITIVALMVGTGLLALRLMRLSLKSLILGVMGAVVGLLLGVLLSVPLGKLPGPFGDTLPIAVSLILGVVMIGVFLNQEATLTALLPFLGPNDPTKSAPSASANQILVDTSVIIDGRIADIAAAGFVPGKLLVPRFVLAELQNIADSDDAMRRGRGRRGLEMLNSIRQSAGIEVEIIEQDLPEISEVDAKLVGLAKKLGTNILTTDYNLNRVAQIEGVRVLNINELSNAIRPVVLPGEEMVVKIVQAGKERNQGVGYLADGTMIVVDNGDKLIGQELLTEVTRVFQTVAGKMIFATPKKALNSGNGSTANNSPTASSARTNTKSADIHSSLPRRPSHDSAGRRSGPGNGAKRTSGGARNDHNQVRRPQRPMSANQLEDSLIRHNAQDRA